MVTSLARVAVRHDRGLQEARNYQSVTIWLYDKNEKQELVTTSLAWPTEWQRMHCA